MRFPEVLHPSKQSVVLSDSENFTTTNKSFYNIDILFTWQCGTNVGMDILQEDWPHQKTCYACSISWSTGKMLFLWWLISKPLDDIDSNSQSIAKSMLYHLALTTFQHIFSTCFLLPTFLDTVEILLQTKQHLCRNQITNSLTGKCSKDI